jgi:Arc/MetJ-type ribon-helix-helix transcriptional regulator
MRQLSPNHEALIEDLTQRGNFSDADQAIQEALTLLEEHIRLQEFRAKIRFGLDQITEGKLIDFDPNDGAARLAWVEKD